MEDKEIVKRTFEFAVKIIKFVSGFDGSSIASRVLCQQLVKSGTSIGANMEEAQAAQSKSDFIHKCSISLKESRETTYWLRLLMASGLCEAEKMQSLKQESEEIGRIIAQIIINSKQRSA